MQRFGFGLHMSFSSHTSVAFWVVYLVMMRGIDVIETCWGYASLSFSSCQHNSRYAIPSHHHPSQSSPVHVDTRLLLAPYTSTIAHTVQHTITTSTSSHPSRSNISLCSSLASLSGNKSATIFHISRAIFSLFLHTIPLFFHSFSVFSRSLAVTCVHC
jgi:hypothetical protein